MIAELVPFLIAIVAVKLALWAAYSLGVLTTVVVANALFWIRRGLRELPTFYKIPNGPYHV